MDITVSEQAAAVKAETVIKALTGVLDPELGVDIVNLGLVYGVHVQGGCINLTMTLTTPGCPLHAVIENDVRRTLERVQGVEQVNVAIVWDPPWSTSRITDLAREQLCGF
jgi:metal-sulfur cluster biosynthetic enzyme